ncbi:hypothetical protein [Tsuneonella sp. HG222]
MTFRNVADALEGNGFDPRTTPIDTLMAAPVFVGLDVALAMLADEDPFEAENDAPETFWGFQEANLVAESIESVQ